MHRLLTLYWELPYVVYYANSFSNNKDLLKQQNA